MALFYRFTHSDPPTVDDFRSQAELGRGKPKDVSQHEWEGVSLRVSLQDARDFYARRTDAVKARLGPFITEVDLPNTVDVQQTSSDPGHYSAWASANELHGYMTQNTVPAVA